MRLGDHRRTSNSRAGRIFAAFVCAATGCGLREGYAQLYFLGALFVKTETEHSIRPERLRAIARRLAARPNHPPNKRRKAGVLASKFFDDIYTNTSYGLFLKAYLCVSLRVGLLRYIFLGE